MRIRTNGVGATVVAVIAAAGAALGVAGLAAQDARADNGPRYFTLRHAGSAWFEDQGDHVYACDHIADNRSVAVRLKYRSESGSYKDYWRWNWWGPDLYNGCRDFNLAAVEGTQVWYRVCLGVHGRPGAPRADVLASTCSNYAVADN
jgi:hypothetical protein